jgi:hypothetical protein
MATPQPAGGGIPPLSGGLVSSEGDWRPAGCTCGAAGRKLGILGHAFSGGKVPAVGAAVTSKSSGGGGGSGSGGADERYWTWGCTGRGASCMPAFWLWWRACQDRRYSAVGGRVLLLGGGTGTAQEPSPA